MLMPLMPLFNPDAGVALSQPYSAPGASLAVIYVAHPYASDPKGNVARAAAVCREIAEKCPGVVPVCPLLAFRYLPEHGPADRGRNMAYCLALLERCDELFLAGDWERSEGCLAERRRAVELGIPVREWLEEAAPPWA